METSSTNSSVTNDPIALLDSMAVKANPWAVGLSILMNGVLLALVLGIGAKSRSNDPFRAADAPLGMDDLRLLARQAAQLASGGGGRRELIDPIVGRLPKFESNPIVTPQVPIISKPQLAVEPSIATVRIPDEPVWRISEHLIRPM